jgi:thiol:disulfide interchange protein DsbD
VAPLVAFVLFAGVVLAGGAAAVDVLPPHEAFALSARALDASTLEARFNIVDGYYLYRDKLKFSVATPAPVAATPQLPPGKMKHDEFFGDSETYRGLLVVRLPLAAAEAGRTLTLVTESQGCADAGVCYPPQRQSLEVMVPAAGAGPGPLVLAPEGRPAWLK